jgi:hypothetical protein
MVVAAGGIPGKLTIQGTVKEKAVVLAGGSIGSKAHEFSFLTNNGIIAARKAIVKTASSRTAPPGYFSSDAAKVPPPDNFDAKVIDMIFESSPDVLLNSFDLKANGDLSGLTGILSKLARLYVQGNAGGRHLALRPPT